MDPPFSAGGVQVVCKFPLFASDNSKIPKYWIVFASRHRPAVELVNDAMARARERQYDEWKNETLFRDVTIPDEVSLSQLEDLLLQRMPAKISWQNLRIAICQDHAGIFSTTQLNRQIKAMLTDGKIHGANGRSIENNAVLHRHGA